MKPHILTPVFLLLAATPRQAPGPADLALWRLASDPRLSAAGTEVVYVENRTDRSRNTTYTNLYLISSDGLHPRTFTEGEVHDRSPRWSPDGSRLAWLRSQAAGGPSAIWVSNSAAPAPAALTALAMPVTAFAWSPDGKSIAFLSDKHLFVIASGGGEPRRLAGADLHFEGEPAWTPDGENLVCAEKAGEIFAIRAAEGTVRQLTRTGEINREPVPSPDGSKIAFTASASKPFYSVRRLWVMNADGSRSRQLGGTLDRDVRYPQWSNDSRTVYFIADDRGATHVYLARNDGTVRQLTDRRERLDGFSLADNGRAVTVRSSAGEGSAVFTFMDDVPAGGYTLVDVDQQLLAERNWGTVEEMPFQSGGKAMQAWLVKPFDFNPARKYPLLAEVADSPPRLLGVEFPLRAHVLAASGLVVLRVNSRGTPSFGEEFGDLLPTEIAEGPAEDLVKAIDVVLAKGYIDARRIYAAGGASAAWLLGHSTRFAGIIADHPLADLTAYPAHSPIAFAETFQTRTLILAATPDSQAEKLQAALQKQKVEVTVFRSAPDPQAQVHELEAIKAFLTQAR